MSSYVLYLISSGLVGSFVGGFIFRATLRAMYGVPMFQVSFNCCPSSKKRFRLIELIPILGSMISELKDRGSKDNFAGSAILSEVGVFLLTPVIMFGLSDILYQILAFIVLIIGQIYVVYSLVSSYNHNLKGKETDHSDHRVFTHIRMVNKVSRSLNR